MTRRDCLTLLALAPAGCSRAGGRFLGGGALTTLLAFAPAGCARRQQQPLAKAAAWLWSRQAADGGWHSRTYGLLRSGQSLTPFVLEALLAVPHGVYPRPAAGVDRALGFLRSHTSSEGALGLADPDFPDYPNYATALAVKVLSRWDAPIAHMLSYLRAQQFTERNGWRKQDPAYGAWGMGGERRTPPETGHVDLSMTRHVLEALRASGVPASDSALAAARVYVARCQNADGGFFFTTTEFDTNKAGHDGDQFRSYGTATADGILALLATGARPGPSGLDPHVVRAARWLSDHHRGFEVPGFVGEAYQRWPRGLSFYYAAAVTQAYRSIGAPPPAGVKERLRQTQRPDGSWSNPGNLVKEDDPLIATAFAIRALSESMEYWTHARDLGRPAGGAPSFRPGGHSTAPQARFER